MSILIKPMSILIMAGLCAGCAAAVQPSIEPQSPTSWTNTPGQTLIVLSAPSVNDPYYRAVFDDIIAYDIEFARSVIGKDNIIILADEDTLPYFEGELPDDVLLQADVYDIWIRDFALLHPANPVKFTYAPDYLGVGASEDIDTSFRAFLQNAGVSQPTNQLIIDGGNFVHNGGGKAVVTDRIYYDNPSIPPGKLVSQIKTTLNLTELAVIPEEAGDTTGHSDGMVTFVSEDTLLVNTYEEPFRSTVLNALEASLTDVTIVEIPSAYELEIWKDFVSACGIYVNALVTPDYIYMPVFDDPLDDEMIAIMTGHSSREVVPINASDVCFMGGSVRCLTWQIWGRDADALVELARNR